jgi:hypothetical protein
LGFQSRTYGKDCVGCSKDTRFGFRIRMCLFFSKDTWFGFKDLDVLVFFLRIIGSGFTKDNWFFQSRRYGRIGFGISKDWKRVRSGWIFKGSVGLLFKGGNLYPGLIVNSTNHCFSTIFARFHKIDPLIII